MPPAIKNMSSEDMYPAKRLPPLSSEGVQALVQLVHFNPVVTDKKSDSRMVALKNAAWEKIARDFNAVGLGGGHRHAKQLKKIWDRLKSKAKNEYDIAKRDMDKSGSTGAPVYSDTTAKVLGAMHDDDEDIGNIFDGDSAPAAGQEIPENGAIEGEHMVVQSSLGELLSDGEVEQPAPYVSVTSPAALPSSANPHPASSSAPTPPTPSSTPLSMGRCKRRSSRCENEYKPQYNISQLKYESFSKSMKMNELIMDAKLEEARINVEAAKINKAAAELRRKREKFELEAVVRKYTRTNSTGVTAERMKKKPRGTNREDVSARDQKIPH